MKAKTNFAGRGICSFDLFAEWCNRHNLEEKRLAACRMRSEGRGDLVCSDHEGPQNFKQATQEAKL